MNSILFFLFIPNFIRGQDSIIYVNSFSKQPLLSPVSFEVLLFLAGATVFYFFVYFFVSIRCCKPKYGKKPTLLQIIFNVVSLVFIIIGCIIIIFAIPKLIIKESDSDIYNNRVFDQKKDSKDAINKFYINFTDFSESYASSLINLKKSVYEL